MNEIVRIPFHGDELLTVEVDGRPHVLLKPIIEELGLDYWAQVRKLRARSWACTASKAVQVPGDGQRREYVTCDVRTLLMLLATIDENRVAEEVRAQLVIYQAEVADVIEAYWTQGGAINPRATDEQLATIISRAKAQAEVLTALAGIVDPKWLEAKARHVAARALGEEPEVPFEDRPISVGEYLEERGVKKARQRSIAPKFGKRVKAAFLAKYGREPQKVDRFIDGATRSVFGYTEADRHLFDAVWADLGGAA